MTDTTVTEAPRNDAGQFASTEPAYGQEGLERAAGYVPLETAPGETPDDLTVKEAAADRLRELSGSQSKIITHTAGLPDNVTMTLDQAADALKDARGADAAQAEIDGTKAAQKEVDKLRGDKPAAAKAPEVDAEIDVERVLQSPKVKEAISAKLGEAETQRAHHETAVGHATNFAIASLFSEVPELTNLRPENWVAAIQHMQQREPARAQLAISKLQALGQVEAANQQIKADKAAREAAEFRTYSQAEDARFAAMVKSERNMPAIEAEIVAMVKDYGVEPREFFKAGTESKFLRSAAAQKILVDAAKYRMMHKAAKATPTRAVPNIQKPGHAGPRVNQSDASLAALSAKLNQSGNLKDAAKLLAARRTSKGR